jgi:hypothetical protein
MVLVYGTSHTKMVLKLFVKLFALSLDYVIVEIKINDKRIIVNIKDFIFMNDRKLQEKV